MADGRAAGRGRRAIIAAAAAAIVIGGWAYGLHVVRRTTDRRLAREQATWVAHRQQLLEDQAALARLSPFAPRPGHRDAAPLLAPRVEWDRPFPGGGTMPIDLGRIEQREDWLHAGPEAWEGIDLGWMAELAGYDHWDVDGQGPVDPNPLRDPEPYAADLLAWAKLRIAKGVHDGAPEQALREVLELDRLCFTTERMSLHVFGGELLALAALAQDRLKLPGPLPGTDADTLRRLRRALYGAAALARLTSPAEAEADLARSPVGRCAALREGLADALYLRAALKETRAAGYEHLGRMLAAAPDCRLARMRARWAAPDDPRVLWPDRASRALLWIPGVRGLQGELRLGRIERNWLKGVFEEEPATAPNATP